MNYLVRDQDVIFNLAGQVSHIDSMRDPYTDLEINCRAQLSLLEACRHHNPGTKVVFAGTRQVYGRPESAAGHRSPPGAADRRQRHQQGGRRVLPPGLQQRLRRARLLAAPDQRLRPAAADPPQPPGLHRLVRPAGARRRRDPDLRRRLADPRLRLRGRRRATRSCAPAPPTPSTARCSTSAAPSRPPRRPRARCWSTLAAAAPTASSSGRPRRRPSTSATSTPTRRVPRAHRLARRRCALRDGPRAHPRLLPRALRAPTWTQAPPHEPRPRPRAVQRSAARRRRAPTSTRPSPRDRLGLVRARPGGRGLRGRVRRAHRRRARGRRRHRHRRHRAGAARARHRPRRRGDHVAALGGLPALAIDMAGARPVFVDIDPERLTIDPAAVAAAVTPRTRAIVPVHLYGQPADMTALARGGRAARPRRGRGRLPGAPGHAPRRAGRAAARRRPPSASTRPRTSARSATAAP